MHESGSAAVSSQTLKVDGRGALLTTTAAVILLSFQYKDCAGYHSEALQRLLHGAAASADSRRMSSPWRSLPGPQRVMGKRWGGGRSHESTLHFGMAAAAAADLHSL